MKRITAIALFIVAGFVSSSRAIAQDRSVRATVPFDFTVANKLLPSGTYTITPEASGVIMIQNSDKHIAVLSQTSYDSHGSRKGGQLVFDRYGDQYFLSEILCQTAAMNVNVAPSKQEKRARTQQASLHNASQVYVATK